MTTEEKFIILSFAWQSETIHLSSVKKAVEHPYYQAMSDLGPEVIPLIFTELRERPHYWFKALSQLTGHVPFPVITNYSEMRGYWLAWGIANGYIKTCNTN